MRISIPAIVVAALLAVLVASPASAEVEISEPTPQLTQQVVTPNVSLNLETVQIPAVAERVAVDAATTTAQPTRTSWWWLVAAIVVAGVIIGVLVT